MWETEASKRKSRIDLPQQAVITIQAESEVIVGDGPGGGGFGDPLERDPEAVRWDAREEYITLEAAADIYGVVLNTEAEAYSVDYEATDRRRRELREKRKEITR
jgi:N-methylhydantoinase B